MSPIKGISEVIRLPRLGKIRLGIKKDFQGTTFPEPTDYFVCPDEVKKLYGEKPRMLHIMFPTNNPEQWASQYLRCYSESQQLICRGNGKTAITGSRKRSGDIKEIVCNPVECKSYQQGNCQPVMNLQFLIPACLNFGVYQLDTSSYHSMVNINSSLELARNIFGRVAMIPFSLILEDQEVQPDGQYKVVKVLDIIPTFSIEDTIKLARLSPESAFVFPPPDNEAPEDLIPEKNLETQDETDEERIFHLWDKAKSKVWQMDIQNYQIEHFFQKNYKIEVGLKDFFLITPPHKFNIENLTGFLSDIERHTRFAS